MVTVVLKILLAGHKPIFQPFVSSVMCILVFSVGIDSRSGS